MNYSSHAPEWIHTAEYVFLNFIGPGIDIAFWGIVGYGLVRLAVHGYRKMRGTA